MTSPFVAAICGRPVDSVHPLNRSAVSLFASSVVASDLLGVACPPPSNTGGKFPSDHAPEIAIDWLQGSFPFASMYVVRDVLRRVGCDFAPHASGRWGHATCEVAPNGTFLAWTCERSDAAFCVPGSVCGQLTGERMLQLVQHLKAAGARFTRLDVRFDDYERTIEPADVYAAAIGGAVVHFKRVEKIESGTVGGPVAVTCNIGKRAKGGGGRMFCIYDKLLESGDEAMDCVRWECRLYDDRARESAAYLADSVDAVTFVVRLGELVGGNISFVDRSSCDKNVERLPLLPWWAAILERLGRVVIRPLRVTPTLRCTMDAIQKQYGTGLACVKVALEQLGCSFADWFDDVVSNGEKRWRRSHTTRVSEFLRAEEAADIEVLLCPNAF